MNTSKLNPEDSNTVAIMQEIIANPKAPKAAKENAKEIITIIQEANESKSR